jgi:hypothetical protein
MIRNAIELVPAQGEDASALRRIDLMGGFPMRDLC